jgi:hypothetical protein
VDSNLLGYPAPPPVPVTYLWCVHFVSSTSGQVGSVTVQTDANDKNNVDVVGLLTQFNEDADEGFNLPADYCIVTNGACST